MYVSADALAQSIRVLRSEAHPFVGITFVACKQFGLAIENPQPISLDGLTKLHMDEFHRLDRRTPYYFQPFKSSGGYWVAERYPSTGLQTVNTQTFVSAFNHPKRSKYWAFSSDYIHQIASTLIEALGTCSTPADALALWLYRDVDLGLVTSHEQVVQRFFREYNITEEERRVLFGRRVMDDLLPLREAFAEEPLQMTSVLRHFPRPPDAAAEVGRTIASLELRGVGPSSQLSAEFGQRLTVITGDNGLGKSFLLEAAWWAATASWWSGGIVPTGDASGPAPEISFKLRTLSDQVQEFTSKFDWRSFDWRRPAGPSRIEALAVYGRSDGSFSVADPLNERSSRPGSQAIHLSAAEVWDGRPGVIEGLLRDWITWEAASDRSTFDRFASVLKRLSPEDLGEMVPGPPIRLPGDVRQIPTITHRYGVVPVTQASSGVRRVLLLAYLAIWAWREHEIRAARLTEMPSSRMLLIVDEIEAHLHPKWQRSVLPALMSIGDVLSAKLALQIITATHSPMVMASLESSFNDGTDALYHLFGQGKEVVLHRLEFARYGDVSGWLMSPVFGLQHARSREAEVAIETAKQLQLADDPDPAAISSVNEALKRHLSEGDKFWPRWMAFADSHGVTVD